MCIVEGSCGYRARRDSIRRKFVLSRVQDEGGRHAVNHSSHTRVVVDIVAPFAPRVFNIRGKLVLSKNPGYKKRGFPMWLNVVLTPG